MTGRRSIVGVLSAAACLATLPLAADAAPAAPTPDSIRATTPASTETDPDRTLPPLPDASPGPYLVGHTTMTIPATAGRPLLNVDIWYPARRAGTTITGYPVVPGIPGIAVKPRLATELAQPRLRSAPYPLVVYSHGSGAFRTVSTFLTEVIASHGYVVASVDHPGDTILDAFARDLAGVEADLDELVRVGRNDLRRVITAVNTLSRRSGSHLDGMVDRSRTALIGHSLGGARSLSAAAYDRRVDAVITMDPTWTMVTPDQFAAITAPTLTLDGILGSGNLVTSLPGSRNFNLIDAGHAAFTDLCTFRQYVDTWIAAGAPTQVRAYIDEGYAENCTEAFLRPRRVHALAAGFSIAFLDLIIKGEERWDAVIHRPRANVREWVAVPI